MKKFDLSLRSLLTCNAINNIIGLFSGTFLVAYLYQSNTNPILTIGLYYSFTYLALLLMYVFLGYLLVKSTVREWVYRTGILLKCIYILAIVLLSNKFQEYIIFMGLLSGISEAFYWSSFNVMKNVVIKRNMFKKYSFVDNIFSKTIHIVLPIILGTAIEISSFVDIAIYLFILTVLQLIFSFFVKSKKLKDGSYSLNKFWGKIAKKKEETKALRQIYTGNLLNGIRATLSTTITILTMMTFGTNISLGFLTSIFAIFSMLLLFTYVKTPRINQSKLLYLLVALLPVISVTLLSFSLTKTNLVIYNFMYVLSSQILDYELDVNRNILIKILNLKEDIVEHQATSEIFLGIGRIFSFLMLFIIGLLDSIVALKVFIMVVIVVLPFLSSLLFNIEIENGKIANRNAVEENKKNIQELSTSLQEDCCNIQDSSSTIQEVSSILQGGEEIQGIELNSANTVADCPNIN